MNDNLTRVLVTGGSRGIGRSVCNGFAERGARVAFSYHSNRVAAEATMVALSGDGHWMTRTDV